MNNYIIPQQFNQSDKIGKFTMPQVVVLGIAATIYILIVMSAGLMLSIVAAIPIGLMTFMFMFIKINRIPLYEFVLIYIIYVGTPKLLIYRSDNLKSDEEIEEGISLIDKPKQIRPVKVEEPKKVVTTTKEAPKKKKPKNNVPAKATINKTKKTSSSSRKGVKR